MAKLNVTIPAVDVEVNGVKYRKVDRKAQAGDIVRILRDGFDINYGDFFVLDDQLHFLDNAGDHRDIMHRLFEDKYEVYELVKEQYREVKRPAKVGERIRIVAPFMTGGRYDRGSEFTVRSVDRDGSHDVRVGGDGVSRPFFIAYKEYVVLEPVETTQPERLQVGDYAKVIDNRNGHSAKVGDIVKITRDDRSGLPFQCVRADGTELRADWFAPSELVRATDEEVAAAKDPRNQFAKGDKVRLINGGGEFPLLGFTNGEVYEVKTPKYDDHSCAPVVQITGGKSGRGIGYAKADQLEKVSAEQLAEIERKKAEEAERAKWAAIGRKVNEYKRGDIVSFTRNDGKAGIGAVEDVADGAIGVRRTHGAFEGGGDYRGVYYDAGDSVTLIVPVEQRFDRLAA